MQNKGGHVKANVPCEGKVIPFFEYNYLNIIFNFRITFFYRNGYACLIHKTTKLMF